MINPDNYIYVAEKIVEAIKSKNEMTIRRRI